MLARIPKFVRNFYFIFAFSFLIWMLFFDTNDLFNQFRMSSKLSDLKNEKEYYQEKIQEVRNERAGLFSNNRQLEQFARENYLMKKKTEDVYLLVEEK